MSKQDQKAIPLGVGEHRSGFMFGSCSNKSPFRVDVSPVNLVESASSSGVLHRSQR